MIFAVFSQASSVEDDPLPIDPNSASPATVLSTVSGVRVSTPIRPVSLNAIGYHPEGENLIELSPRGENLSGGLISGLPGVGATPEKIGYHVMDPAGRPGPKTGAVDVGAESGARVYAPVSGVVTDVRPDPEVRDAEVVGIKPEKDPGLTVRVSGVREADGLAPQAPVTAGMTEIGRVASTDEEPQLASYAGTTGDHVTVSAVPARDSD